MNMFKSNGGFTLVELIVVIAILASLAGIAIPAYAGYIDKAKEAGDQTALSAIKTAVMAANATEGTVIAISYEDGKGVTGVTLAADATGTAVTDNVKIGEYYGGDLTKLNLETGNTASWRATESAEGANDAGWTIPKAN